MAGFAGDPAWRDDEPTTVILQRFGISLAPERLVASATEAVEAARAIGYPVVLKVQSRDLPHKT